MCCDRVTEYPQAFLPQCSAYVVYVQFIGGTRFQQFLSPNMSPTCVMKDACLSAFKQKECQGKKRRIVHEHLGCAAPVCTNDPFVHDSDKLRGINEIFCTYVLETVNKEILAYLNGNLDIHQLIHPYRTVPGICDEHCNQFDNLRCFRRTYENRRTN